MSRLRPALEVASVWVTIVTAWAMLSMAGIVPRTFLASPGEVFLAALRMSHSGTLVWDAGATFGRALAGLTWAALLAIPAGILLGTAPRLHDLCRGPADYLRSIPPVLFFPIALLAAGPGEGARIGVVGIGVLPVLYLHASRAALSASRLRLATFEALGATWFQRVRWIVLPESVPGLITGMRVSLSLALVIAVVTEMLIGARHGLGAHAVEAQLAYRTADLYVLLLAIGALGSIANHALAVAERRTIGWSHAEGSVRRGIVGS